MATTSVKVALRVRPLTQKEILENASACVSVVNGLPQVVVGSLSTKSGTPLVVHGHPVSEKSFTFDYVYGQNSAQYELYDDCVAPLVSKFVEGFNATVLAYGQTGSGKTYSMGTALDSAGDNEGIVQRAVRSIFDYLHSKSEKNPAGFQYSIAVSFLELYNEELVDLLNPRRASPGGWGGLSIRENSEGAIVWSGVREENVRNADEILRCLQKGTLCRTTASTEMNTTSSRSHAIFSVILRQQKWQPRPHENDDPNELLEGLEGDLDFVITENPYANPITHPDGQWVHLTSKFHFVDLAGSERLKKTNAAGDRKKEGISINQGLLALGNVISVLGDESKRGMHVPYRDSKLTRMLQDSLGGNSQTLMLACVSPSDFNYGETINTLNYANRARNIRNRVLINQDWAAGGGAGASEKDQEIRVLRAQLSQLRSENEELQSALNGKTGVSNGEASSVSSKELEDRGRFLEKEVERIRAASLKLERELQLKQHNQRDLRDELHRMAEQEQATQFDLDRLRFRCCRLYGRSLELNNELVTALAERDKALVDLGFSRKTSPLKHEPGSTTNEVEVVDLNEQSSDFSLEAPLESSKPSPDVDPDLTGPDLTNLETPQIETTQPEGMANLQFQQILHSYIQAIAEMRFRLANAEDKLAWYNEVVISLTEARQQPAGPSEIPASPDRASDMRRKWRPKRRRKPKSSTPIQEQTTTTTQVGANPLSSFPGEFIEQAIGLANPDLSADSLIAVEVPQSPVQKSIAAVQREATDGVDHEYKLWRALKQDPEISDMLSSQKNAADTPSTSGHTRRKIPRLLETNSLSKSRHLQLTSLGETDGAPNGLIGSYSDSTSSLEHHEESDGNLAGDSDTDHESGLPSANTAFSDEIGTPMSHLSSRKKLDISRDSDKSADMFLLVHKLQMDIADQETLMRRLLDRDTEYNAMRRTYEQQLGLLQSQLADVQKQRDEAMKRVSSEMPQNAHLGLKEKKSTRSLKSAMTDSRPGTAAIRQRHEDKVRKLEQEISLFKRKLDEYHSIEKTIKQRHETLTKNMTSTIQSLKAEKSTLVKQLKEEATRVRKIESKTQIEIAALKRREKAAMEMAKRLERSQNIQRAVLERRTENIAESQNTIKQVMNMLERASPIADTSEATGELAKAPTRISQRISEATIDRVRKALQGKRHRFAMKSIHSANGARSPLPGGPDGNANYDIAETLLPPTESSQNLYRGAVSRKSKRLSKRLSKRRAEPRVDLRSPLGDPRSPFVNTPSNFAASSTAETPLEVRVQLKKQMLDKELTSCVAARKGLQLIRDFQLQLQRLADERQDLFQSSAEQKSRGFADDGKLESDERLQAIEGEISLLNVKIGSTWTDLKNAGLVLILNEDMNITPIFTNSFDTPGVISESNIGWENALNMLRSLSDLEVERVAELFMDEIVTLRIALKSSNSLVVERDKTLEELRHTINVVRKAALQTAMDYEQRIKAIEEEAANRVLALRTSNRNMISWIQAPANETEWVPLGQAWSRDLPNPPPSVPTPVSPPLRLTIGDMRRDVDRTKQRIIMSPHGLMDEDRVDESILQGRHSQPTPSPTTSTASSDGFFAYRRDSNAGIRDSIGSDGSIPERDHGEPTGLFGRRRTRSAWIPASKAAIAQMFTPGTSYSDRQPRGRIPAGPALSRGAFERLTRQDRTTHVASIRSASAGSPIEFSRGASSEHDVFARLSTSHTQSSASKILRKSEQVVVGED